MSVVKFGDYTFFECSVAFHLVRDNVYSPWVTIGVCFTSPKYTSARYLKEYLHYREMFLDEVDKIDNKYITTSREFLSSWGRRFYRPCDVMSPVVNYCTGYRGEFVDVLTHLFTRYAGNNTEQAFKMIMVMLKMKDLYLPDLVRHDTTKRDNIIRHLLEEKII